jgi:hypothetical protein
MPQQRRTACHQASQTNAWASAAGQCFQTFALVSLGHLEHLVLFARQMALDSAAHQTAQAVGRDGVKLD